MLSAYEMLVNLAILGLPIIVSIFFALIVEVINVIFIGNTGTAEELSGVGLGNMFITMTTISPVVGINSALATLVSQSYGQGNLKLCGVYLNRARVAIFLFQIPISFLLFFSGSILKAMNMGEEVSEHSSIYVKNLIIGLFAFGQYDATRGFCNYLQKSRIPMIIALICSIFHLVWCYLFIWKLDFGVVGASYASCLTYITSLVLAVGILSMDNSIREAWFMPGWESFKGLKEYFMIALPNGVMTIFEFWAFELLTLMSGYLSVYQTSAQVIIMNILLLLFTFNIGVSVALAALIGNAIGEGSSALARKYQIVVQTYGLFQTMVIVGVIFFGREIIVTHLTDIPEVQLIAIDAIRNIIAISTIFDLTQEIQQGIIRGMGKSELSAVGCFICFYCIGVPLGGFFAFQKSMGIQGLWSGVAIGLILLVSFYQYVISFRYNWDDLVIYAKERSKREMQAENEKCLLAPDEKF